MQLTDHLTDEQLNEYLDNETGEREAIESHLSVCAECGARLTALQTLFVEIESLPELELTSDFRERRAKQRQSLWDPARVVSTPRLIPRLPRWLTLTATLQAILALIALILGAPFVMNLLPEIEAPSLTEIFLQLQSQWVAWLEIMTAFELPAFPEIPAFDVSSVVLTLTLAGASLLWVVGNGLLLRNDIRR